MKFFSEYISEPIFLNIRKYISVTLNNGECRTFFEIIFGSRIKAKTRSKEVLIENGALMLWKKGDLNLGTIERREVT
mgnify:CR=1 FL=1